MKTYSSDILVIGGGGAGLMAAVTAQKSGKNVIVVSKLGPGAGGCTTVSAAAFSHTGTVRTKESHREDTLRAGQGLNESFLVNLLVENAAEAVGSLNNMGANLELGAPGHYGKAKSPFFRGPAVVLPMTQYAKEIGVEFVDPILIWELIIKEGRVIGAWGFNIKTEEPAFFLASSVILASGGGSAVYARTDNPASITGDGYALAMRAGLGLIDMEFVQFYPIMTAFGEGKKDYFLVPQTADPAIFVNEKGIDLSEKYAIQHPIAIKSRDLTSRVMMLEKITYLDFSKTTDEDWEKTAQESNYESTMLLKEWLKPHLKHNNNKIPMLPTAHFCAGGIPVNDQMETKLPGLFAAGEVTGGLHGANRLGGNALSEAIVTGKQAGLSASASEFDIVFSNQWVNIEEEIEEKAESLLNADPLNAQQPSYVRKKLTNLMWEKAGVLRTKEDLTEALQQINGFGQAPLSRKEDGIARVLEVKNMLLTGELICRSAIFREESRGCHYRLDFPDKDNSNWLSHSHIIMEDNKMVLTKQPVK